MSIQQTPVCQGTAEQPLAPKRIPKQIPIETKNEPHSATYPDVSLSPNKEEYNKTHLIIKLNKLSIQNKTRSVDDENDLKQGNDLSNKAGLKRSTSAKMRNQKFVKSDLLQSPTYEYSHNLANQNSAFRLKPSHNIHTRIPVGNHGNNKKARFQNISEESTESGIFSNSQNSTTSVPGNQSDCDVPESLPTFGNDVPTLATGIEDRNLNMGGLEETIRANFEKREEPIYENLPFGYKVSKHRDQSDLHLQAEVLRQRDILNTMGGVESLEQVYKELKSQKFKILELELMIEKLKRDNEILKSDSHQKQQAIQTHIGRNIELKGHLNQLIGQNKELLFELRHLQSVKFPPNPSSQIPPKMPPMYTPPNEKLGAKQEQYAPIRNEHRTGSDPPQIESVSQSAPFYASSGPQTQVAPPTTPLPQFTCHPLSTPGLPPQQPVQMEWMSQSAGSSLPRRVSQSEFGQFQLRPATLVPSLINQSNYAQRCI